MKIKVILLVLISNLMLVSCRNQPNQSNLLLSEVEIVYEEPIIQSPHLVIVFDYTYDFEKPSADFGLSLEEFQEQLNQDRKNAKEFYTKKNTEYLEQLDLKFESKFQARISISNYTNMVFIRFADYVVEDDMKDIISYLTNKKIVKSAYFNEG